MALKRKLFSTPARKTTQAKRIRTLERKVAMDKTEVQIKQRYADADLSASVPGNPPTQTYPQGCVNKLSGSIDNQGTNQVVTPEWNGRNYKTVSVKVALAQDINLNGTNPTDVYRYRMILYSNKNDSGEDNTAADFPGPYDEASLSTTLDFNIDEKRFTVYDDKCHRNDIQAPTQVGLGKLEVMQKFRTPKRVRLEDDGFGNTENTQLPKATDGMIGLIMYRQNLTDGTVELVTNEVEDSPKLNVEHKWIDP